MAQAGKARTLVLRCMSSDREYDTREMRLYLEANGDKGSNLGPVLTVLVASGEVLRAGRGKYRPRAQQAQQSLEEYLEAHGLDPLRSEPADVVLGLLRLGTAEALEMASEIVGKPITRCPPAVPPWPPLPVQVPVAREQRVVEVGRNPCLPTTDMFQKFRLIKQGMTRTQLMSRGVTRRDLRIWTRSGHIQWSAA